MALDKTIAYLKELRKHDRDKVWFHDNYEQYATARDEFKELVEDLTRRIAQFDTSIEAEDPHSARIMRINNDLRFNPDKPIYKSYFGVSIQVPGFKKDNHPVYYLSVNANDTSFFGGGMYRPDNKMLKSLRASIKEDPSKIENVLNNKSFKQVYKDLNRDITLKQMPRDYKDIEHHQDLFKLKSFTTGIDLTTSELSSSKIADQLEEYSKALYPLVSWMRSSL